MKMELMTMVDVIRVETYDGEVHFLPQEKWENFVQSVETSKFIVIQGEGVAVKSIKNFKKTKEVKEAIALTKDQRDELERFKRKKFEVLDRPATEMEIATKIDELRG